MLCCHDTEEALLDHLEQRPKTAAALSYALHNACAICIILLVCGILGGAMFGGVYYSVYYDCSPGTNETFSTMHDHDVPIGIMFGIMSLLLGVIAIFCGLLIVGCLLSCVVEIVRGFLDTFAPHILAPTTTTGPSGATLDEAIRNHTNARWSRLWQRADRDNLHPPSPPGASLDDIAISETCPLTAESTDYRLVAERDAM